MFKEFLLSFTAVFVALDIVGILPLYLGLTQKMSETARRDVVNTSMLVAFIVALVFVFLGSSIFHFIGITVFDFKVAGGLVLLLVSLADLLGGPETLRHQSGNTGVVPLAVPLITGPGVLTTLILQVGFFGYTITLLALVSNYLLGWFLLRKSEKVTHWIGKDGTVVISKIAALLLAAIAVSMIRGGIFDAIHVFNEVQ